MKRLTVVSLACLLSACGSGLAELRQAQPDKVADFPAAAADLSDCVHRAMKTMESPDEFRLNARIDKLEFYITATRVAEAMSTQERTGIELRFIAHDQATSVEMREGDPDRGVLPHQVWPLIERCAQQLAKPSAASPTAP